MWPLPNYSTFRIRELQDAYDYIIVGKSPEHNLSESYAYASAVPKAEAPLAVCLRVALASTSISPFL